MTTGYDDKHPLEDKDSWKAFLSREHPPIHPLQGADDTAGAENRRNLRRLSKSQKRHEDDDFDPIQLESIKTQQDLQRAKSRRHDELKRRDKEEEKRKKRFEEVYRNPGIGKQSVHGLMVRFTLRGVGHRSNLLVSQLSFLPSSAFAFLTHTDRRRVHRLSHARLRIRTSHSGE